MTDNLPDDAPNRAAFVIVGFDDPSRITAGFDRLAELAAPEADIPIRILDIEFIHSIHGIASTVPAGRLHPGLAGLDRLDSRLLGQADLDVVAAAIPPGSTAAVVVYGGAPIQPVLAEWSRAGATVLREGPVDRADLAAARAGAGTTRLLGG